MQTPTRKDTIINWSLFTALCIIWGSSFILMKIGLQHLTAMQVAALRIASASIALLPFTIKAFLQLPKHSWGKVIASGLLGSFFPAFLFCFAELKLSSAVTGMINSLTPLFTVVLGVVFFKTKVALGKWLGIAVGLIGLLLLVSPNGNMGNSNFLYVLLVVLATVMYACNVNLVSHYLKGYASSLIAGMAFGFLLIPAIGILIATNYFALPMLQKNIVVATGAALLLGVVGTAFASVLFYKLVKRAGALFASMVTYGIPIIALIWGLIFKETIVLLQFVGLAIILLGVYLVNRKKQ